MKVATSTENQKVKPSQVDVMLIAKNCGKLYQVIIFFWLIRYIVQQPVQAAKINNFETLDRLGTDYHIY